MLAHAAFVVSSHTLARLLYVDFAFNLVQRFSAHERLPLWTQLLDALLHHPWRGYGWNQVAVAHTWAALNHPPMHNIYDHSHNIVLDLLLWNGIPLGCAVVILCSIWLVKQVRGCNTANAALLLGWVGILLIHGMLEFPLEYAYFLLPLGVMVGALSACRPAPRLCRVVPAGVVGGVLTCAIALSALVVRDYPLLEANMRQFRFQAARVGTDHIDGDVPHIVVLTQIQAFLRFARQPERRGMNAEELEGARDVAFRFPYAPALFRYALLSGLNGHRQEAADTLQRLCNRNLRRVCEESVAEWSKRAATDAPELARVRMPKPPPQ
jgi:hypothetical protein